MGVLSDTPVSASRGREGEKFIRLYQTLDPDDQARIRDWAEDPTFPVAEIARRLQQHFDIGYSSVERGIWRLKASSWEC